MKIFSFVCFFLIANSISFSQIESGKKKHKKTKKTETSNKTEEEEKTILSLSYAFGNSYRILKSNGDFYGEELGEKSFEKPNFASGVYLNANSKFDKNIYLDFGLGFQQFSEKYTWQNMDTSIFYENKYNQVVVPLKIHFQRGKSAKFFFNTGFQAQLLSAFKNDYTFKLGENEENTITTTLKNKNSFSLASTSSIGVQLRFSPNSCLIISGDFIQQLSSSYNKQAAYIHKPNFYGFKIGLGFKI